MLRTPAPLIGALYVSGLNVGEGRLADRIEALDVRQSCAVCSREFSWLEKHSGETACESSSSALCRSGSTRALQTTVHAGGHLGLTLRRALPAPSLARVLLAGKVVGFGKAGNSYILGCVCQ